MTHRLWYGGPLVLVTAFCSLVSETRQSETLSKAKNWRESNIEQAVILSDEQKDAIVARHNARRSIAEPKAANMRKMSWDAELATLAREYSRKCIYEHNPNRWHSRFRSVGENLFISMHRPMNTALVTGAVSAWDDEKVDYTYNTGYCVPGRKCGHYTQIVWDDSFKVGCAVTICKKVNVDGVLWTTATLFVCNYGPAGNYPRHPFQAGTPCSACHKTDKCENNLCTNPLRDEPYKSAIGATWQPWSSWSPCPENCIATRTRLCSTFVEGDCKGLSQDSTACVNKYCGKSYGFQEWGKWSECSTSCGGGIMTKTRTCIRGVSCGGFNKITMSCNDMVCIEIDGKWREWGLWGSCSKTCGKGIQKRSRSCMKSGTCQGSKHERMRCALQPCKIDHKDKKEKKEEFPSKGEETPPRRQGNEKEKKTEEEPPKRVGKEDRTKNKNRDEEEEKESPRKRQEREKNESGAKDTQDEPGNGDSELQTSIGLLISLCITTLRLGNLF